VYAQEKREKRCSSRGLLRDISHSWEKNQFRKRGQGRAEACPREEGGLGKKIGGNRVFSGGQAKDSK